MAVKMEGPLTKWTNVVQGWQYRWFVLDEHTGLLSYYTSKDRMMRGARRGCLRLKGGKIGINDEDDSTFTITCDHRTFHFQARDSNERTQWVKCLEETIAKHGGNDTVGYADSFKITEDELNQKMQEAEAYFRILTQQVKKLESQMNHSTAGTKSERSLMLKDSLTQMVETMGQTIELLHNAKLSLAKKVPVPVMDGPAAVSSQRNSTDNIPQTVNNGDDSSSSLSQSNKSMDTGTSSDISNTQVSSVNNSSGEAVEVACEMTENESVSSEASGSAMGEISKTTPATVEVTATSNLNFVPIEPVPITTYTSSDDEDMDEFFDANEQFSEITVDEIETSLKLEEAEELRLRNEMGGKEIIDMNIALKNNGNPNTVESSNENTDQKSRTQVENVESSDVNEYEAEDDDDDAEAADMSSHGSVITHLLSQVKIGMDLTKVTLPTFILERRSLLEMYADFFAHPDLFKGIPDLTDASDRMIQVLRWYLSSFHAGRKSTVAKKPYNPILGETFQCFFDLTEDPSYRNNHENMSREGPIPWGTKEDVTFVAEQVSHHPPISAFYAECENKRVCFNSHIWTKSKFLGLSIGVHMAGSGSVYVSDYDEEYIMTFPNAYCRSILTMPWVELGGKTEITCPTTGFSAQIEFLTKPFYGGKKNRLTADVYAPSQKKPFLSVNGEWNGIMHAKRANSSETEVFVDTFNMPIVPKKVKLISNQEEFESRRLWKDVTIALKTDNIDGASAGKHKLEEKQRQDARVRKETDTKWVTRLFDEEELGEGGRAFHYKWPLYKRQGLSKPGANAS